MDYWLRTKALWRPLEALEAYKALQYAKIGADSSNGCWKLEHVSITRRFGFVHGVSVYFQWPHRHNPMILRVSDQWSRVLGYEFSGKKMNIGEFGHCCWWGVKEVRPHHFFKARFRTFWPRVFLGATCYLEDFNKHYPGEDA